MGQISPVLLQKQAMTISQVADDFLEVTKLIVSCCSKALVLLTAQITDSGLQISLKFCRRHQNTEISQNPELFVSVNSPLNRETVISTLFPTLPL
jgi:hypothetical protein